MKSGLTSDTQKQRRPFYSDSRFAALRLLRGVSPESIELYLEDCEQRSLEPGELLLSPQIPNKSVYAILSGSLTVHLLGENETPLTTLPSGSCAGEMSIIDDQPPSAWVRAAEPTQLLILDQATVWEMINTSHAFARNLLAILSERLRADNEVISDSEGVLRQYERNAMTDALTELFNRHWLDDMFRRKLQRCEIDGQDVCLVMLDVDFFKSFNDVHGHIAGDHALCTVADALRQYFRPTDMIARYGGDEFAIMLPDTLLPHAMEIAERVRAAVGGDPGERNGPEDGAGVTVSIGIAERQPSDTLEMLVNNADTALYRAKLAGRNCVSN
ncbi:MAG: GGDEF domain-containing protein [Gammaproteobacteria bacterium]|nr:GGDEF domain-containing protein [Gammaproteobacteria bacterium]